MELVPSNFVLVACLLSLLVMVRLRRHQLGPDGLSNAERLDTVLAWPPSAGAPLSEPERAAYGLLRSALSADLILAHIPLARFIRVPARRSHGVWLKKAGRLSADLLVCDHDGQPIAVVEVRTDDEPARAGARRARMQRVVQAAGISLHVWTAGQLPTVEEVRSQFAVVAAPEDTVPLARPLTGLGELAH